MLEDWRFRRQLRRLQHERRVTFARHGLRVDAAKTPDDRDAALAELNFAMDEEDEGIAQLRHIRMTELAERYGVPVPHRIVAPGADVDKSGAWERSRFTKSWFLSEAEVTRLRATIRQEKKDLFDEWFRWLPPVVSVLSLVVAILALLLKH